MRRIARRFFTRAVPALLSGLAAAADVAEDEALYLQSLVYAGVLAYCTERQPAQASAHAEALAGWLQRNQAALARGEAAARGGEGDGAAEAEARRRIERAIAEIRALPPAAQQERCQDLRRGIG
ncbi:hypothetical protein [Tahibacter harae]|uniref:Uncharacterized protein n=1 Tax=Tahibacter harae TaxID=2963937 RepID=A0ABT1QV89_9GAMM|nr:hypothetical protein [Tahibacter harae]MCQ4166181.1 hypothetical protein [Tahibacter harae]